MSEAPFAAAEYMPTDLVDAHVHLFSQFGDFSVQRSVSFLNSVSESDWELVCRAAQFRSAEGPILDLEKNAEGWIVPFLGIHPWAVLAAGAGWDERLETLLRRMPNAGVGEVGLDAWKPELQGRAAVCLQKTFFQRQLALAVELGRPVSIHCVRAWELLWAFARPILSGKPIPILFHAFSGSPQLVTQILEKEKWNAFFSLASFRFQPQRPKSRALLRAIPKERLLLETDAESAESAKTLPWLYGSAAECLGISEVDLAKQMRENAQRFLDGTA